MDKCVLRQPRVTNQVLSMVPRSETLVHKFVSSPHTDESRKLIENKNNTQKLKNL